MLQISREEWDGLVNGTDRATPTYIAVDASLTMSSSEAIELGDLWQDIQKLADDVDADWDGATLVGKNLYGKEYELSHDLYIVGQEGDYVDIEKFDQLLCDFRKAIIEKFYEIEVEDAE